MRLGLIARADNSGLGVQCLEFARHMHPAKVLVIDVSHLHNDTTHTNKATYLDRYPNAQVFKGWQPDKAALMTFMHGLDVVFGCETMYSPEVYTLGRKLGVKTVLQPNFEFLDLNMKAKPDLFASPSLWHFDEIPQPKLHLPVPIATDRFTAAPLSTDKGGRSFLHIVGRPAHLDRNGTADLLKALQYVTAKVTVTIKCQTGGYVGGLIHDLNLRTEKNITLRIESGDVENYWDNYGQGDVLIMPRRFGGLCLPVNEALGAGMPVIMPNISPNNTWLPDEWLVEATPTTSFWAKNQIQVHAVDPRVLAAKIDAFTDAGFYAKAKTEALELRDQLSWDTLKPTYDKVLCSV